MSNNNIKMNDDDINNNDLQFTNTITLNADEHQFGRPTVFVRLRNVPAEFQQRGQNFERTATASNSAVTINPRLAAVKSRINTGAALRPGETKEAPKLNTEGCVTIDEINNTVTVSAPTKCHYAHLPQQQHVFDFDGCFSAVPLGDTSAMMPLVASGDVEPPTPITDERLFAESVLPAVRHMVKHRSPGLFAVFGQSGTGKSRAAFGSELGAMVAAPSLNNTSSNNNAAAAASAVPAAKSATNTNTTANTTPGMLTLAANELLSVFPHGLYVAIFEVYSEKLRCLFSGNEVTPILSPQGTMLFRNLHRRHVGNLAQLRQRVLEALRTRKVAATGRNDHSSRSHAVIQLFPVLDVVQQPLTVVDANNNNNTTSSTTYSNGHLLSDQVRFTIVDLAGSERFTAVTPQQQRESAQINLALSNLGRVVQNLTELRTQKTTSSNCDHICRASALTWSLRDELQFSAVSFLICISPMAVHAHETLSSLRFASMLRSVRSVIRIQPAGTQELRAATEAMINGLDAARMATMSPQAKQPPVMLSPKAQAQQQQTQTQKKSKSKSQTQPTAAAANRAVSVAAAGTQYSPPVRVADSVGGENQEQEDRQQQHQTIHVDPMNDVGCAIHNNNNANAAVTALPVLPNELYCPLFEASPERRRSSASSSAEAASMTTANSAEPLSDMMLLSSANFDSSVKSLFANNSGSNNNNITVKVISACTPFSPLLDLALCDIFVVGTPTVVREWIGQLKQQEQQEQQQVQNASSSKFIFAALLPEASVAPSRPGGIATDSCFVLSRSSVLCGDVSAVLRIKDKKNDSNGHENKGEEEQPQQKWSWWAQFWSLPSSFSSSEQHKKKTASTALMCRVTRAQQMQSITIAAEDQLAFSIEHGDTFELLTGSSGNVLQLRANLIDVRRAPLEPESVASSKSQSQSQQESSSNTNNSASCSIVRQEEVADNTATANATAAIIMYDDIPVVESAGTSVVATSITTGGGGSSSCASPSPKRNSHGNNDSENGNNTSGDAAALLFVPASSGIHFNHGFPPLCPRSASNSKSNPQTEPSPTRPQNEKLQQHRNGSEASNTSNSNGNGNNHGTKRQLLRKSSSSAASSTFGGGEMDLSSSFADLLPQNNNKGQLQQQQQQQRQSSQQGTPQETAMTTTAVFYAQPPRSASVSQGAEATGFQRRDSALHLQQHKRSNSATTMPVASLMGTPLGSAAPSKQGSRQQSVASQQQQQNQGKHEQFTRTDADEPSPRKPNSNDNDGSLSVIPAEAFTATASKSKSRSWAQEVKARREWTVAKNNNNKNTANNSRNSKSNSSARESSYSSIQRVSVGATTTTTTASSKHSCVASRRSQSQTAVQFNVDDQQVEVEKDKKPEVKQQQQQEPAPTLRREDSQLVPFNRHGSSGALSAVAASRSSPDPCKPVFANPLAAIRGLGRLPPQKPKQDENSAAAAFFASPTAFFKRNAAKLRNIVLDTVAPTTMQLQRDEKERLLQQQQQKIREQQQQKQGNNNNVSKQPQQQPKKKLPSPTPATPPTGAAVTLGAAAKVMNVTASVFFKNKKVSIPTASASSNSRSKSGSLAAESSFTTATFERCNTAAASARVSSTLAPPKAAIPPSPKTMQLGARK